MMLAIDFGTSNTLCSAVSKEGSISPIFLEPGDREILPSILFFVDETTVYFGSDAILKYSEDPESGRLIKSIKTFLADKEFSQTIINGRPYSLEQIIATLLRHVRSIAETQMNSEFTQVILGRPVCFSLDPESDDVAEQRLVRAAAMAGFTDISLFHEPSAAAYSGAYQLHEKVLTIDLGGGTSDYSLTHWEQSDTVNPQTLSLYGVPIAGDRIDGQIMASLIGPEFGSEINYRLPLSNNWLKMPPSLKAQLTSPAHINFIKNKKTFELLSEIQKTSLSKEDAVKIKRLQILSEDNLGYDIFKNIEQMKIQSGSQTSLQFDYTYPEIEISRKFKNSEVFEATDSICQKIRQGFDETLKNSGESKDSIDQVIITGGTSLYSPIRQWIQNEFVGKSIVWANSYTSVVSGLGKRGIHILNES